MIKDFSLIGLLTLYNISIALTEAWKWRMDSGKPDNHPFISYHSYHVWRSICSASVVGLIFVISTDAILIGLSWIGSVLIYERIISFVQYDNWNKKRKDFHILNIDIPRPNPGIEWVFMILCYLINTLYILNKAQVVEW